MFFFFKKKKQDVNFQEPKAKHNCAFKTLDRWWVRDGSYYDYYLSEMRWFMLLLLFEGCIQFYLINATPYIWRWKIKSIISK